MRKMAMRKRLGFSLTELVIVILIIGIIAAVGIGFGSRQIAKGRMTTMTSNLRIVASDLERAVVDLGMLNDISDTTYVTNYFTRIDKSYTTCALDIDNITYVPAGGAFGASYSGVIIPTIMYEDPWGNELQLYYMLPTSGMEYRLIVASGGPNGYFADDAANGYINGEYEDDVLIVMEPRDVS